MLADAEADWMGWVVFVGLVLSAASFVPLVTWVLRRRLPDRRRAIRRLPPLRLGRSERTRRSPRQAVGAHRTFLTGTMMTGISLMLIPFASALGELNRTGLLVAIAFVVPSLVVAVHSRRRDLGRKFRE